MRGRIWRHPLVVVLLAPGARRVVPAFALFTVAEWVVATSVAVEAYGRGGALAVGLIGFRFGPAAVASAAGAGTVRRSRPARLLTATAAVRAVLSALVASAAAGGAPLVALVGLVWVDAAVGSAYRPAQAALLPSLVRSPRQLTAAAALTSYAKTAGQVLGAFAGGALVVSTGIGTAVTVGVVGHALAALLTAGLPAGRIRPVLPAATGEPERRGIRALRAHHSAALVATFAGVRSLTRGLWVSLAVVAAITLLGTGGAGFGQLMAASGVGSVVAIGVAAALIGTTRLSIWFALALAACGLPLVIVGAAPQAATALAAMVVWGAAMAVSDVAGQALLHRLVPGSSMGPVTGVVEATKLGLEGLGSLVAPLLISIAGIRGALVVAGLTAPVAAISGLRTLSRLDRHSGERVALIDVVRGVRALGHLRLDALEAVAARLERIDVAAGTVVIQEHALDSRTFYLVETGRMAVEAGGFVISSIEAGSGFGEVALLRDSPRTATVRATTASVLLALGRADFLNAISGPDGSVPVDLQPAVVGSDARWLLHHALLLGSLPSPAVTDLASRSTRVSLPAGAALIVEGEVDDSYYVIARGCAAVMVGGMERHRLLPGDGVGEIAVLYGVPRQATVFALEPLEALHIPGADLRQVLKRDALHCNGVAGRDRRPTASPPVG